MMLNFVYLSVKVDRSHDGLHGLDENASQAEEVHGKHVPTEAQHLAHPRRRQSHVRHAHQLGGKRFGEAGDEEEKERGRVRGA